LSALNIGIYYIIYYGQKEKVGAS